MVQPSGALIPTKDFLLLGEREYGVSCITSVKSLSSKSTTNYSRYDYKHSQCCQIGLMSGHVRPEHVPVPSEDDCPDKVLA